MDLLVPLTLFRVRYETASGRPYSELEKLVLLAIAQGANSLIDLQQIFLLRSRLLIEALITLARAGWVAIDVANGGFRVTAAGQEAAGMHQIPAFTVVARSEGTLIMESITGELIGQHEMKPYLTNTAIQKQFSLEDVKRLPIEFRQRRLDPGQVFELLDRKSGEWIRWVDVPELVSREFHWLHVAVDHETGTVHNLPDRWRRTLGPVLVTKARAMGTTSPIRFEPRDQREAHASCLPTYPENFSEQDLLLSRQDHFEILRKALSDAQTTIFIASAFFDTSEVDPEIRNSILGALRRGVCIYLLWGYGISHGKLSEKEAISWLRDLRKEAGDAGTRLRFNQQPTDSHAKFLIFDCNGEFQALVGSCNWLSTCLKLKDDSREPTEVTVRLRHPRLIASLCRSASGLWLMSRHGAFADAPEALRRTATRLDSLPQTDEDVCIDEAPNTGFARVRIIRDQQHESVMRDLMLQTKERCLVVSHKLGAKAEIRLAPLRVTAQNKCKQIVIQYAKTTQFAANLIELNTFLEPLNGALVNVSSQHSKILVMDQIALVSSYNFLSADPFGNFSNSREVGVLIEGGKLPDLLWNVHVRSTPGTQDR